MSEKTYENIVYCLNTLNEFVQGPCPENQQLLVNTKFFVIAQVFMKLPIY